MISPRRFSPHTRGCSDSLQIVGTQPLVFPAYAGMFLSYPWIYASIRGFPRIRGDVPSTGLRVFSRIPFSPHTRGCSANQPAYRFGSGVFPAYAGMFPGLLRCGGKYPGFPRIRGDVPNRMGASSPAPSFSPHTRGCSALDKARLEANKVFPAYAGMFRIKPSRARWCICFPRIRGDVPGSHKRHGCTRSFSPHTRGCSGRSRKESGRRTVFPAYAGMFRPPSRLL